MNATFLVSGAAVVENPFPSYTAGLRVGRLPTLRDRSAPLYLKRSELHRGLLSEPEFHGVLVKLLCGRQPGCELCATISSVFVQTSKGTFQ